MTKFIIRVQLKRIERVNDPYPMLYSAMLAHGFTLTILADSGKEYWLPDAMYRYVGNLTRQAVLEKAKEAVKTTGLQAMILVATYQACSWSGLERADAEEGEEP